MVSDRVYATLLATLGLGFAGAFVVLCVPPFLENPDVLGAFGAGFVNPYASGYSLDTITCWLVLALLVTREPVPYGWTALLIGIVPGVATGFAVYLLLRLSFRGH